jgi:hypothetical protein
MFKFYNIPNDIKFHWTEAQVWLHVQPYAHPHHLLSCQNVHSGFPSPSMGKCWTSTRDLPEQLQSDLFLVKGNKGSHLVYDMHFFGLG